MAQYIDPMQAKEQPKPKQTINETAKESTTKMVMSLMSRSRSATKDARKAWRENYDFAVNGKQWSVNRPAYRFKETVNLTLANMLMELGIQTDGDPTADFSPTDPSDFEFTKILKMINDSNWQKPSTTGHAWKSKLRSLIFKSKYCDVVWMGVFWDKTMENGLGDVRHKILNPFGCFWDPDAEEVYDMRYFIYAEPYSVEKLKQEYPDYESKIKSDVQVKNTSNPADGYNDYNTDRNFAGGIGLTGLQSNFADRETAGSDIEKVMLIHCWIKDESVIEEEEEKEDGTIEFVQKKQYPRGRYIKCTAKCVLEDRDNEYEDGYFPVARLVNYDIGEMMGENEVKWQIGPQKLINYTYSHGMDQFKKAAAPQKILSQKAISAKNKLTDEPGSVVVVPDINDIRFESGPGINPSTFSMLNTSLDLLDRVQGSSSAGRGDNTPGATSGYMLEGMVEAAQTRPRLKNRSVDDFLTQVAYLDASRYLQFYKLPRVFRMTNEQGWPKFVEFSINENKDENGNRIDGYTATVSERVVDPNTGAIQQSDVKSVGVKGLPDVMAQSGASLPFSRTMKAKTASDLYNQNAITLESYLESINWPNAKEEAVRVREQQQAMAQQAQGQA